MWNEVGGATRRVNQVSEREQRIWDAAFDAAFATYHTTEEYRRVLERQEVAPSFEERAARYADFVAFRAVAAFRQVKT